MIVPTVTAISREAMAVRCPSAWPRRAYGLGATRWKVIFPRHPADGHFGGIFGALVLGFGRAIGETMALAMLVGNANVLRAGRCSRPPTRWPRCSPITFPKRGKVEVGALRCTRRWC